MALKRSGSHLDKSLVAVKSDTNNKGSTRAIVLDAVIRPLLYNPTNLPYIPNDPNLFQWTNGINSNVRLGTRILWLRNMVTLDSNVVTMMESKLLILKFLCARRKVIRVLRTYSILILNRSIWKWEWKAYIETVKTQFNPKISIKFVNSLRANTNIKFSSYQGSRKQISSSLLADTNGYFFFILRTESQPRALFKSVLKKKKHATVFLKSKLTCYVLSQLVGASEFTETKHIIKQIYTSIVLPRFVSDFFLIKPNDQSTSVFAVCLTLNFPINFVANAFDQNCYVFFFCLLQNKLCSYCKTNQKTLLILKKAKLE